MISTEQLMSHVQKAFASIEAETIDPRSILSNPLQLGAIAFEGEERRLASESRLGIPVPRFCIFSVTWRCNLDCVGCYAKDYAGDGELTLEEIDRVVREAAALGSFVFIIAGGEPLMVDGLVETLGRTGDALFLMFTNGTLLDDATAEAIAAAGNVVPVVSIDGPEHITDSRRGPGVSAEVGKAMAALCRAGAAFAFSSMVTHENIRDVTSRQWCESLWQAGARFGFLIDYVPIGSDVTAALVLTDADREFKTAALAERFAEARPLVMNFPPDEYVAGYCQSAGRGMIHVNADGYVEPCPFAHYAADNVREKPLSEILASPFLQSLRQDVAHLPNPRGECQLHLHAAAVRGIAGRTEAFCTEHIPRSRD